MDIDLLSKIIKELIMDTDEVTLPGVGTFVAEIVPSTFSDKGYTINPPYRRLSFRHRQVDGDTMISDFYASSNNLDRDSAKLIIADFMRDLKEVLEKKKMVVFPGLGRLRATRENTFFFVADEDLDIYPAGFGLEPVSLKSHEESEETVSAAIANLKGIITEPEVQEEQPVPEEHLVPEGLGIDPESLPDTEPEKETVPEAEPVPAPVQEPVAVQPVSVPEPERKTEYRILLWIAVAAVVLLVLFAILGRVAPDFIDKLLYTEEELEILRF